MRYALIALGGVILGLVGLWLIVQRRKTRRIDIENEEQPVHVAPQTQALKLRAADKYWGFRIESHCRASSHLAGRQYPFEESPPLPVEGCESGICECCLIGMAERREVADRRSGQDRRRSIRMDASDRRAERPRRKGDLNSWISYSHL